MSRQRWYKLLLSLPIVLPCLTALMLRLTTGEWFATDYGAALNPEHPVLSVLLICLGVLNFFLLGALMFGGVQYLVLVGIVLYWSDGKTAAQMARASWLLPIVYFPLCALGLDIFFGPDAESAMGVSMAGLVLGYFYVFLAHILTWIITQIGWVEKA